MDDTWTLVLAAAIAFGVYKLYQKATRLNAQNTYLPVPDEAINRLCAIFPEISRPEATAILRQTQGNVEDAANVLLSSQEVSHYPSMTDKSRPNTNSLSPSISSSEISASPSSSISSVAAEPNISVASSSKLSIETPGQGKPSFSPLPTQSIDSRHWDSSPAMRQKNLRDRKERMLAQARMKFSQCMQSKSP